MSYKILKQNISVLMYISDVGANRLLQKDIYLTKKNNNTILNNADILKIETNSFVVRQTLVKELSFYGIEGSIYIDDKYMYGLLFPIDLIIKKHILVKKWKACNIGV